jgi:hypothetical protein
MFVIQRNDGAFVAKPGNHSSYTRDLQEAWTFATREEAKQQLCPENETIVNVADILGRNK